MKLDRLRVENYRSLRSVDLELGPLNLLIGANASGKSNILNALRFLAEGAREKDFAPAVKSRGNIARLAWKGDEADHVSLWSYLDGGGASYEWSVRVDIDGLKYAITEDLRQIRTDQDRVSLLHSKRGSGWWRTSPGTETVKLALSPPTGCALSAAAADESFPGRGVLESVNRWAFFDPSPIFLRRASFPDDEGDPRLDEAGRNLAGRLYAIREARPETFRRIVAATNYVLGVPQSVDLRRQELDGRIYFVQTEAGLSYPIHQLEASSGTLRMLALMTALLGEDEVALVGIEEPENYIHPNALEAFASQLLIARKRVQIVITTHSPLLLTYLNEPEAVCVVRRGEGGTEVEREPNPAAVRKALDASGFGLGAFYESKGFGG